MQQKKHFLITLIIIGIFQFTNCLNAFSQNINEAGISELASSKHKFLQSGEAHLQEAVNRNFIFDRYQGKETCQTCRFEFIVIQDGSISQQ